MTDPQDPTIETPAGTPAEELAIDDLNDVAGGVGVGAIRKIDSTFA